MWTLPTIVGLSAAFVGIIGYIPYYRDAIRGKTKPHPLSWIVFTLLLVVIFMAQVESGAGPGAWVTGVSVLGVGGIMLLSFIRGERHITRFDWLCFLGAIFGVLAWHFVSSPLVAVMIVTTVNMVAFLPTVRKAYEKPHQETALFYLLAALKFFISLFALSTFDLTTGLFPVTVITSNVLFVSMLFWRRRSLGLSIC